MRGTILAINADGTTELTEVGDPRILVHLRRIVGGYIEGVPLFDTVVHGGLTHRCVAFCNEEGKIRGLPINAAATLMWERAMGRDPGDVLMGNVAVVWGDGAFMSRI